MADAFVKAPAVFSSEVEHFTGMSKTHIEIIEYVYILTVEIFWLVYSGFLLRSWLVVGVFFVFRRGLPGMTQS